MATRSISIALEAKVQGFVAGLKTAAQAANDFSRKSAQFARDHEQDMDRVGKAGMLMGGGLLAGVGVAVKSFMDFDKAMSEVQASTHETAGTMDQLRTAAINAGADTAFSAAEAAKAIDEMAKAGVSVKDILGGGLSGALSLAAAGSMEVGEAAELAATAMTQFKLQGKDLPHVSDLLAAGAGKAQGSVHDMGFALKQSGLVANMFGVSIEETVGSLAAFASAGLVGSDAGTSMKQALLMLAKPTEAAQTALSELGIATHDTNGNFVGMADLAGQLHDKMGPLTDAQRQQAMATIFGADAIRVANALYEEGADGINAWTAKVNDAGYAAETAALKQDNLAGDFEKLTGSLDSVFIKSASGANGALRGLVQGAEDLVDSIGQIPGPVLQAGAGIAGTTGLVLLAGGAFTSTVPKIMEGIDAFKKLETAAPRAGAALKGAGLVAGMFAVAGALGAIDTAITDSQIERSVGKTTSALIELSKQSSKIQQCSILLDDLFQKKDGSALISGVTDLDSAMTRMFRKDWQQSFSDWGESMLKPVANMMGVKGAAQELDESFNTIDEQLASFVKSGNPDIAAKAFKQLEERAALKGIKPEELKAKFSSYSEALKQADADAQLAAEGLETITTATGRVVPVTPDVAKALDDIGVSASGAAIDLEKFTQALFNAGLSTMGAREAEAAHEAAIDGVKGAVEEATAALAKQYEAQGYGADAAKAMAQEQMNLGAALNKSKTDFDLTTDAGRILNAQFQQVASTGIAEIEAKAKAGAGQPELQANLHSTYDSLITALAGMGIVGGGADTLARKVLGIPKQANINTWMSDEAKRMAEATAGAIDAVDGRTAHTYVYHHEINTIENITTSSASVHNNTGGRQGAKPTFHAAGGAILGPGTGTSDDILAMLSNGEHVLTAEEVRMMGGQDAVYRMRALLKAGKLPKFAGGGAADKAAARREFWLDYQRDSRRGNGYRTVTSSLSSAYSYTDRLTSLADSGNVSAASIRNLYTAAGRGEAGLRSLHARADKLSTALDKAKDKVTELSQKRDSIRGKLNDEFSIGDAMKNTSPFSAVTVQGIQGAANSVLARIRTFAGKLNKLRAMGYSGAVLEEIAGLGSVEGMVAADALLKGSKADVKNLNGVYGAIDSASKAAGTYVTDAMYKGGINAANGLVKGLQSQEKAIEQQMLKIGLGMERELKKALGIRSPSRKAAAIGSNFTGTLADKLAAGREDVAKQAGALGDAMSIVPTAYTPAVSFQQVPNVASASAMTLPNVRVYVGNEEFNARIEHVASGVVVRADGQSQYTRTGRR